MKQFVAKSVSLSNDSSAWSMRASFHKYKNIKFKYELSNISLSYAIVCFLNVILSWEDYEQILI